MHWVTCSCPAFVIVGRHIGSGAARWLPWEPLNKPRQIPEMAIKRNFADFTLFVDTQWEHCSIVVMSINDHAFVSCISSVMILKDSCTCNAQLKTKNLSQLCNKLCS